MPYAIRKLPNKDLYRVYNKDTKVVHSYSTTLENAKKQVKLLHMVDAGVPLKKGKGCCPDGCNCMECNVGGAISKKEKKKIAKEIRPITEDDAVKSYLDLADEPKVPPNTSLKGNKFVDYFTFIERLETTGRMGISFWDFWENKSEYMKKSYVKNLLNYYKKNFKDESFTKRLYKVFKLYFGSVGMFKPVIAMSIYDKYKPNSVLDFTMGWGGRLVGAAALDVPNYIGIDINKNLEQPYREMEKTLKELGTKTNIQLLFQDALDVDYSRLDYDMVFTSPPYYNTELYSGINQMTEEEWNDKFYIPIFTKTWKYLKVGGHYILNVSKSVYENVLVKLLGKADKLIPMRTERNLPETAKKQEEYKEYIYVWKKDSKIGGSIETDKFEKEGVVSIPEINSVSVFLPTYMYKKIPPTEGNPSPYKYKLVVPITYSRNLSSRGGIKSVDVFQKPVSNVIVDIEKTKDSPKLKEFSPEDRAKIKKYYENVKMNESKNVNEIYRDKYEIVPRGRPLPCPKVGEKPPSKTPPKIVIPEDAPKVIIRRPKKSAKVIENVVIPEDAPSVTIRKPKKVDEEKQQKKLKKQQEKEKKTIEQLALRKKLLQDGEEFQIEKAAAMAGLRGSLTDVDKDLVMNDFEGFKKKYKLVNRGFEFDGKWIEDKSN